MSPKSTRILFTCGMVLAQLTAAGCRRNSGGDNNAIIDPSTLIPESERTQLVAVNRDASCTPEKGQVVSDAWIHELAGGLVGQQKVTLTSPLNGAPSLTSNYINKTDFNHYFQVQCNNGSCNDSSSTIKTIGAGEALPLCQTSQYDRASAEDIAITAATSIEKSYLFYNSLNVVKPTLGKVALAVHPYLLIPVSSSKFTLMTDNLTFAPEMGDLGPTVSVYPKTLAGERLWPDMNLWESSWVLNHEMTHAIFANYANQIGKLSAFSPYVKNSFGPIIGFDPKSNSYQPIPGGGAASVGTFNLADKKIDRDLQFLVTGVNEGIADLFGHLTMNDPTGAYVEGFHCFDKTRAVVKRVTADGVEKIFSPNSISRFDIRADSPSGGSESNCERTIFADPHSLGAFIAYSFNQTMESFGVTNGQDKGILVITWLPKFFKTKIYSNDAFSNVLSSVIYSFVEHVNTAKPVNATSCASMKDLYSGFYPNWKSSGAGVTAACQ